MSSIVRRKTSYVLGVVAAIIIASEMYLVSKTEIFDKRIIAIQNGINLKSPLELNKAIPFVWKTPDSPNGKGNDSSRGVSKESRTFFIAFSYWEQLTMATTNLMTLAALAAYSGRRVVAPFVKNSYMQIRQPENESQTMAFYFNLSSFNKKLASHGYSTLASWEAFQDICHEKLDLLLYFIYRPEATRLRKGRNISWPLVFPCSWSGRQHEQLYKGFQVAQTICLDVEILKSIERFNTEVSKGRPCIGIEEWRGNGSTTRANFPLPSTIHRPLSKLGVSFFNEKLMEIARDFISRTLDPTFISVHLRTEAILFRGGTISTVIDCFNEMAAQVQHKQDSTKSKTKIFVAGDFLAFGSHSGTILPARDKAKLLINQLNKQFVDSIMIFFDPQAHNLLDSGSVAIVEMNILASGSQFFSVGGGSFQDWIRHLFVQRHNNSFANVYDFCTT